MNPFLREGGKTVAIRLMVEFKTSSAELATYEDAELNTIAGTLKANPTLKIRVEGYTDSTGNPKSNQALSERRANAVRSYLINQGAGADQIEAKGYGAEQPVASNATSEGRTKNRRVMAVVVSQ
jgi:outer membrane protein OmpA-like peptidoglycan-associated protein